MCTSMPQYAGRCWEYVNIAASQESHGKCTDGQCCPKAAKACQGPNEDFFMFPLEASGANYPPIKPNKCSNVSNMSHFTRFTYIYVSYQTLDGKRIGKKK